MKRPCVLLYNPRAEFFTMPLALMAVGSALDSSRFDVRLVDGRMDNSTKKVLDGIDDAVCLGVSVLSGAPIRDALKISRKAKAKRPDLPVAWGGWHPSLFPEQSVMEKSVDFVVRGQGEAVFSELVEKLVEKEDFKSISGLCCKEGKNVCQNPAEPLRDMNRFPRLRYELIDLDRYFRRKGKRQIDYISSMGCVNNCAFCADPFVYGRRWSALAPERVAGELEYLSRACDMDDVNFQDEAFFTNMGRAMKIASEFIDRGFRFTWAATIRADQASGLSGEDFGLLKRSGLRRLLMGVESGHPKTLRQIDKKISLDQVFDAAEKFRQNDIAAIFTFVVGFPGESPESIWATIRAAKKLRAMSSTFQTPVFYFKPYPGSRLFETLADQRFGVPDSLQGWARFDYIGSAGDWVPPDILRTVENFKFFNRIAWEPSGPIFAPVRKLARWRLRHDRYSLAFERRVKNLIAPREKIFRDE